MKKIALVALALGFIVGCSSGEKMPDAPLLPTDDTPAAAASAPSPEAAPSAASTTGSDPLLSVADAPSPASGTDSLLATPVDGNSAPSTEAAKVTPPESVPLPSSSPTPSVTATPEPLPSAAAASENPEPKLSVNHEEPPTSVMPSAKVAPSKHDTYEEYRQYREREASRKEVQDAYDDRTLFPHEDGAFQLSLDYSRNAFPGMSFNSINSFLQTETEGGTLSFLYFPIRDLAYGRLGLGPTGSAYWTKYTYNDPGTLSSQSTSKTNSIRAFGARAVYEFDYWLGQTLVPFAYYGFDKVTLRSFDRTASGVVVKPRSFDSQYYGGGLHLNLNRLEPKSASRGLASVGIRKVYLSYSYLARMSGTNGTGTHGLGLRFEY